MQKTLQKQQQKARRQGRIRAQITGTPERPRLSVNRSNRYVSAQLIDDTTGTTLAAATSRTLPEAKGKKLSEAGQAVGEALAKAAQAKNVTTAVFDRSGYIYTGVIKAVADGARSGGLAF